eukprot:gene1497-2277_t
MRISHSGNHTSNSPDRRHGSQVGRVDRRRILPAKRRAGHQPVALIADLACLQRGIRQGANADRQVRAGMNQVDVAVVQHQFQLDLRVAGQEGIQGGKDMVAGKGGRQVELEHAPWLFVQRGGGRLGLFQLVQHPACVRQECLATLGQVQRTGRAVEQGDAEVLFKVLHVTGNRGGLDAKPVGGAGEVIALGGFDKGG